MGRIWVAAILCMGFPSPALAQTAPLPINLDHFAKQVETAMAQALSGGFSFLDKNRDGFVTPQEFQAVLNNPELGSPFVGRESFQRADRNRDGKLSRAEFVSFGMSGFQAASAGRR